MRTFCVLAFMVGSPLLRAESPVLAHPHAVLRSGHLELRIALPDAEKGYYRGPRFDWSGIIADARWKGVPLFGEFCQPRDPEHPEHAGGTAEEFDPSGPATFGPVGEGFLKIGVGILRRDSDAPYHSGHPYERMDSGEWEWTQDETSITFRHRCGPLRGFAYEWSKRIVLGPEPGRFRLEYALRNTGDRSWTTEQYGHNFLRIGNQDTGPDVRVGFSPEFPLERLGGSESVWRVFRNRLAFRRALKAGEYAQFGVRGESINSLASIWNDRVGLGLEVRSGGPVHRFVFYATRETVCPESYVSMTLAPGEEFRWNTSYRVLEQPPF